MIPPKVIPFTKYFCTKGYVIRIGSTPTVAIAILTDAVGIAFNPTPAC